MLTKQRKEAAMCYINYRTEKVFLLALIVFFMKEAEKLNMKLKFNVSKLCNENSVNRTYVYQLAKEIGESFLSFPLPLKTQQEHSLKIIDNTENKQKFFDSLTIQLLKFQLENPGAVIKHGKRQEYSPVYSRFILTKYDELVPEKLNCKEFTEAAEIPFETFRKWLKIDREKIKQKILQRRKTIAVPCDANELTGQLIGLFNSWCGNTRDFISYAAKHLSIKQGEVTRLLRIFGQIGTRRRKGFKYRNSTEQLTPGSLSVTDGKEIYVCLLGSNQKTKKTVHLVQDQASNTLTGIAVGSAECSAKTLEAFRKAVETQGGIYPIGFLHDNKPCYQDKTFQEQIQKTTMLIQATPGRGENKAAIEGIFSAWERQVGTINLDDSSLNKLHESAISECFRSFAAGYNHVPRIEFNGKSRMDILRESCPSRKQQEKDMAFLRKLKAKHETRYPSYKNDRSRVMLDDGFKRWNLSEKDKNGGLRKYLSYCEPEAIRQGFSAFAAKMERGVIEKKFAHRYLTKVILSFQEELDLIRAENELLLLCEVDRQFWLSNNQRFYNELIETVKDPKDRCCLIAERAALASLPIDGAFRRKKLCEEVMHNIDHAEAVRRYIRRLYEIDFNIKIALLSLVAEAEAGLIFVETSTSAEMKAK
jgi:hypothetical protein